MKKRISAASLPQRLLIYFSCIAIIMGLSLHVMTLSLMQWIEDEVNQHELEVSAPYAIQSFQQGAKQPLAIGLNATAYVSVDAIPKKYGPLNQYPLGFSSEINLTHTDQQSPDDPLSFFFYRSEFELNGKITPLYLTMPTENVELSDHEWLIINLLVLLLIVLLFIFFGIAINRISKRLISPVSQLNKQLKQLKPSEDSTAFSVSSESASEFSELTDSLNYYRQQNERMIKQEQAFARYASHELRTPLTVITGAAKLQEQDARPEFQARQRERITRAALEMQHTVDALLNLVKHERNHDQAVRKISLNEIEQILEPLHMIANRKQIRIRVTHAEFPTIQPSTAVLRMLLSNLITNAINASQSSEISIEITAGHIKVIDKGSGLLPKGQNHQGHELGLLIVKSLCQRYQWQFDLKNTQPQGCTATLTFPRSHTNNQPKS
ncbi:sensor histidine kinase [Shewanella surugensis]|uniref:histidine kinase n=1 Tax=Shewanella surugensis TaxID=212020 RepID=A0ABT0LER1_9GAMM|nr:HAMP domain-containing sensor histidine kinase [Shewanella surugensis]MCL1125646.1 HAMP domain-containing histidine kinase [Shewanella surugensis]